MCLTGLQKIGGGLINLSKHLKLSAGYTELRVQELRTDVVRLVNGSVNENSRATVVGACARAFRDGKWGFACNPYTDSESLSSLVSIASENACEVAAVALMEMNDLPVFQGDIAFPAKSFQISTDSVLEFLSNIDTKLSKRFKKITATASQFTGIGELVRLATSDGCQRDTDLERATLFFTITSAHGGQKYRLSKKFSGISLIRSFMASPDLLLEELEKLYEKLRQKAEGISPFPGIHECILGSSLTGILAHEAIGHTVEADLIRAGSIAGDFMDHTVASPLVSLVDFASECRGITCPVPVFMDEEGIVARDVKIIENGVLRSFLHNRESAAAFGVEPAGNGRARQYNHEPLIRMRNTAILPGNDNLEEMIASVDKGYYLMDYSNGQADMTGEFMFSVNQGYEIIDGKLGQAIHDTTVSGLAFDVLKSVSAVSNRMEWSSAGCGKKYGIAVGMGGPDVKCMVRIGG